MPRPPQKPTPKRPRAAEKFPRQPVPAILTLHAQGRRLRLARETMKLKQIELARLSGVSPVAINRYEQGGRMCQPHDCYRLCKVLAITSDYVYFGNRESLPPETRKLLPLDEGETNGGG